MRRRRSSSHASWSTPFARSADGSSTIRIASQIPAAAPSTTSAIPRLIIPSAAVAPASVVWPCSVVVERACSPGLAKSDDFDSDVYRIGVNELAAQQRAMARRALHFVANVMVRPHQSPEDLVEVLRAHSPRVADSLPPREVEAIAALVAAPHRRR